LKRAGKDHGKVNKKGKVNSNVNENDDIKPSRKLGSPSGPLPGGWC
jgi:hypothetical protein